MRRRCILCYCGILFCLPMRAPVRAEDYEHQRDKLIGDLGAAVEKAGRKKVATIDFCDLQGNVSELGRFLSEEISIGLVLRGTSFVVVDRANLSRIMAEHKLTMSGLLDPENTKKLGQFSGADALITGTITDLGDDLVLSIKITSTDTAEIVGGARTRIAKSKEIKRLLEKDVAVEPAEGETLREKPGTPSRVAVEKDTPTPRTSPPASPRRPAEGLVGENAPQFSLTTLSGKAIGSTEFAKYRATVLNFVAPNCGFSKKQIPRVDKLRASYEPKGVRFVNVVQTMGKDFSLEEANQIFKELGCNLEMAKDEGNRVGQAFNASGFPTLVVVSKTGKIDSVLIGNQADLEHTFRAQLDQLLTSNK